MAEIRIRNTTSTKKKSFLTKGTSDFNTHKGASLLTH